MVTLNRTLRGARPDKRSIIFRSVERILQADRGLSAIEGLQWLSWRGLPEDVLEYTTSMCPMVCLTFVPVDNEYEATALYHVQFAMRIECVTAGTCIDDSIDFWGMIEDALISTKTTLEGKTVQKYLRECVMVNNPGGGPEPGGLYNYKLTNVGIVGQRPRNPDGTYTGVMNIMISSGMLVGRTVKPA